MKKIGGVVLVFLCIHGLVKAGPYRGNADRWVDSIYQQMTSVERIGQLVNLKLNVTHDNLGECQALVNTFPVGAVTITGGQPEAIIQFVSTLRHESKCNPLISFESAGNSFSLPVDSVRKLPEKQILGHLNDHSLFAALAKALAEQSAVFKSQLIGTPLCQVASQDGKLKFGFQDYGMDTKEGGSKIANFARAINQASGISNIDWAMPDDYSQNLKSSKLPNTWLKAISENAGFWTVFNNELSEITFTAIPKFAPKDAVLYRKRLFDPLLYKQLGFKGIVNGDLEAMLACDPSSSARDLVLRFLKSGGDMVTTERAPDKLFEDIGGGINAHYLRNPEIQLKVKRLLRLKYLAGGAEDTVFNMDNILRRANNADVNLVNYKIYADGITLLRNDGGIVPYDVIDTTNFASLSIGLTT